MWSFQWTREHTPLTDDIRHVLYQETQGIVDLVVKLFMLAQVHAIQLGVMRGRDEKLDAGLLRHVAGESFTLVAPMIEALRTNDLKALALFDDLSPLHDLVQQTIGDATARLAAFAASAPSRAVPSAPAAPVAGGDRAALLQAMETLGLAPDIAERILSEILAEAPGLNPIDVIGRIAGKLQDRGPEMRPVKRRAVRKGKVAPPPLDADDLRSLAARAKTEDRSAHAVFLDAGVVKPPLADFAA
ncbi:hypothetical protein [Azospirillum sp. INR13]|uniref:hypothetical protein n=1 Tax=Azospirillum sp. INR13 TaxID=2596919 RepID=UPI0019D5FFA7|nr:hypothetical protein [Azospirillum sp. INR13]